MAHMPSAPTLLDITTVPVCLDSNQMERRNFKLMMGPTAQVWMAPKGIWKLHKNVWMPRIVHYLLSIMNISKAIIWIVDIDECKDAADRCGPSSKCHNTNGSFICSCLRGYTSPAGPWFMPNSRTNCTGEKSYTLLSV